MLVRVITPENFSAPRWLGIAALAAIAAMSTIQSAHAQTSTVDIIPRRILIEDHYMSPDGTPTGRPPITRDIRRYSDGSVYEGASVEGVPQSIVVSDATKNIGFSFDARGNTLIMLPGKGNNTGWTRLKRDCAANNPATSNKPVTVDPMPVTLLGYKTVKISDSMQTGSTVSTRTFYMAPDLGCETLQQDFFIDGVLRTQNIVTSVDVGAQDRLLLEEPKGAQRQ
jgi:hypothetical protein